MLAEYETMLQRRDKAKDQVSTFSTTDPILFQKTGEDIKVMQETAVFWSVCSPMLRSI